MFRVMARHTATVCSTRSIRGDIHETPYHRHRDFDAARHRRVRFEQRRNPCVARGREGPIPGSSSEILRGAPDRHGYRAARELSRRGTRASIADFGRNFLGSHVRSSPPGESLTIPYPPFHDLMLAADGDAERELGRIAVLAAMPVIVWRFTPLREALRVGPRRSMRAWLKAKLWR